MLEKLKFEQRNIKKKWTDWNKVVLLNSEYCVGIGSLCKKANECDFKWVYLYV